MTENFPNLRKKHYKFTKLHDPKRPNPRQNSQTAEIQRQRDYIEKSKTKDPLSLEKNGMTYTKC